MEKKNGEVAYREIYLQPDSFSAISDSLDGICEVLEQVPAREHNELVFTGYGTSLYLARTAAHAFSTYNTVLAKAMCCLELYYFLKNYVKDRKVLVLPITRKSYTTGVQMAIGRVRSFLGVKTLAVTCDRDNTLYNDCVALSPDTAEGSVIMTHSFTSMIYLATVIAMYAGGRKDEIEAMAGYAANTQDTLKEMDDMVKETVAEHEHLKLYITLGQDIFYGVASECMNKMGEVGLTNSETYCTLEYHRGPMSLVDEDALALLPGSEHATDGDGKLLTEIESYGTVAVAISGHASADFANADYTLDLLYGYSDVQNTALIGLIDQLMEYYITEKKGLDADTPRHLSQATVIKQKKI